MNQSLLANTLKTLKADYSMQDLANLHRKEVNHHLFRGFTLNSQEVVASYDRLQHR